MISLLRVLCCCLMILQGCKTPQDHTLQAPTDRGDIVFPKQFWFGAATAPAHAEDQLNDSWLALAKDRKKNAVKAWHNAGNPELRLKFWTDYKTEIDLAADLGIKVFRMGVDWTRLAPTKPRAECDVVVENCLSGVSDKDALKKYQEIIRYAKSRGMAVMLTLFHHSLPPWLIELTKSSNGRSNEGGWTNPDAVEYFAAFARDVVVSLQDDVDLWVIFNEPNIFASLSYGVGIWPPAKNMDLMAMFKIGYYKGSVYQAFDIMAEAHHRVYKIIKKIDQQTSSDALKGTYGPSRVGVAHHLAYLTGKTIVDKQVASYTHENMNLYLLDKIKDELDFWGINYYGEEHIHNASLAVSSDREYSESGRAINPLGFTEVLHQLKERYWPNSASPPIIVTENGISDDTDLLRPSYIIEHLIAVARAIEEGFNIEGYIIWTVSDNWEWADGYCPKFGLVAVDRSSTALTRKKRGSYELYQHIVNTHTITSDMRDLAWQKVKTHVKSPRPSCRSTDGKTGLDTPQMRPITDVNWQYPWRFP